MREEEKFFHASREKVSLTEQTYFVCIHLCALIRSMKVLLKTTAAEYKIQRNLLVNNGK